MSFTIKKIFQKIQSPSGGFQAFQLVRYLFLVLVTIGMANVFDGQEEIKMYELLVLVGGSASFFWVGGLFDSFLVIEKTNDINFREKLRDTVFSTVFILSLLSVMVAVIVEFAFFKDKIDVSLIPAYGLYLLLELFSFYLIYLFIADGKGVAAFVTGLLSYFSFASLLILPLYYHIPLEKAIWLSAIPAGVKSLYLIFRYGSVRAFFSFDKEVLMRILSVGGPLSLAALLSLSAQYVDGYLVETFEPDKFAVFRYGARELPLVLLLANALSVVQSGEIAGAVDKNGLQKVLGNIRSSGSRLILTMFPLTLVLLLVSGELFRFFYGQDFYDSHLVFDIYLLLAVPRLLFPQSILRGKGLTKHMSVSAGIELILNIGLSIGLYFVWGVQGIALATVIAFMVEKIYLFIICRQKLDIKANEYTPVMLWFAGSVLIVSGWLLKLIFVG